MTMLPIIEGLNLTGISVCLTLIAIILPVKLRYLIPRASRTACSVFFITLAGYLAWVAQLFFKDSFGALNYTATLIVVRALCLIAGLWFLVAVLRCDGNVYASRRSAEPPHPRRRKTD